jgi:hypothetical protein
MSKPQRWRRPRRPRRGYNYWVGSHGYTGWQTSDVVERFNLNFVRGASRIPNKALPEMIERYRGVYRWAPVIPKRLERTPAKMVNNIVWMARQWSKESL